MHLFQKGNRCFTFHFSLYSFIDFIGKSINEMKERVMVLHIENYTKPLFQVVL